MDMYGLALKNPSDEWLEHHGILGQKWGIRRFQNPDGSLTAAGLKRQARLEQKAAKKEARREKKAIKAAKKEAEYNDPRHLAKMEAKKLDNDQLKAAIDRINMEISYRDAVAKYDFESTEKLKAKQENEKAKNDRANARKRAVSDATTNLAINTAKTVLAGGLAAGLNSVLGSDFITKEELLSGNYKNRDNKKQESAFNPNADINKMSGSQLKEYQTNMETYNKAKELQGKHLGLPEKKGKTTDMMKNVSDMTDAEKFEASKLATAEKNIRAYQEEQNRANMGSMANYMKSNMPTSSSNSSNSSNNSKSSGNNNNSSSSNSSSGNNTSNSSNNPSSNSSSGSSSARGQSIINIFNTYSDNSTNTSNILGMSYSALIDSHNSSSSHQDNSTHNTSTTNNNAASKSTASTNKGVRSTTAMKKEAARVIRGDDSKKMSESRFNQLHDKYKNVSWYDWKDEVPVGQRAEYLEYKDALKYMR